MLDKTHVVQFDHAVVKLKQARRRQSARRHFKNGERAAALRAVTAAELYLRGDASTLAKAAASCGSNVVYVKAAVTLIKSEDHSLLRRVLAGRVPILFAARGVQRVANLVAAVRGASEDDLVAFGRTVGVEMLFTRVIEPALEAVQ